MFDVGALATSTPRRPSRRPASFVSPTPARATILASAGAAARLGVAVVADRTNSASLAPRPSLVRTVSPAPRPDLPSAAVDGASFVRVNTAGRLTPIAYPAAIDEWTSASAAADPTRARHGRHLRVPERAVEAERRRRGRLSNFEVLHDVCSAVHPLAGVAVFTPNSTRARGD